MSEFLWSLESRKEVQMSTKNDKATEEFIYCDSAEKGELKVYWHPILI